MALPIIKRLGCEPAFFWQKHVSCTTPLKPRSGTCLEFGIDGPLPTALCEASAIKCMDAWNVCMIM